MSHMYAILAVVGWVWTAVVIIVAALAWRRLTFTAPGAAGEEVSNGSNLR